MVYTVIGGKQLPLLLLRSKNLVYCHPGDWRITAFASWHHPDAVLQLRSGIIMRLTQNHARSPNDASLSEATLKSSLWKKLKCRWMCLEGKEWIWAQKNGKKNEIVRAKMWWCLRLFKEWGLKRNPVRPCIGVVRWSKVRKGKTFFFLSLTGSSAW